VDNFVSWYQNSILTKLMHQRRNDHLDILFEDNLLEELSGRIYWKSKSGKNDMFFLDCVGTISEIYEVSVLQCLGMALNLAHSRSKSDWNVCGWGLISVGIHNHRNPLMETAHAGSGHLHPHTHDVLKSLLVASRVFQSRFVKWASTISGNANLFDEQSAMCQWWFQWWKATQDEEINVSTEELEFVQEMWFGMGHGTVFHKDKKNVGLSFAQYLGFDWNNSFSFGIPAWQCIWEHGPGSMIAIQAVKYYHMSLKPTNGFRMMSASFVNFIKPYE